MPKPGIYKNSKGQYAYWDGNAWGDGGRTFATREEAESFHRASVRWGNPSSSQEPGRGTEFGNMPNTVGSPRVFTPPQSHSVKWGAPGFTPSTKKPQFTPPAGKSSSVPQSQTVPEEETDLGGQSEIEGGLQHVSEPESKPKKAAKNAKKSGKVRKKSKTAIVVVSLTLLGILAAAGYGVVNHKTAIVVQGSGMFKEYSNDKSEKERLSDTTNTEGGNTSGLTYEQLTTKAEEAKKQGNEGQYKYYTQLAEAAKKDADKANSGSSASPSQSQGTSSDTKGITDIGGMDVAAKKANNNDTKALADAKDIASMLSRGECKAAKEKYLPDEGNDGYLFPCDGWDVVKDAKVEVISDDVSMSTGREVVQVRWGKDKDKTQQAQLLFSSDSKLEQVIPMKNS
mgnify:FL=1